MKERKRRESSNQYDIKPPEYKVTTQMAEKLGLGEPDDYEVSHNDILGREGDLLFYVCSDGDYSIPAKDPQGNVILKFEALKTFAKEHGGKHGRDVSAPVMLQLYKKNPNN